MIDFASQLAFNVVGVANKIIENAFNKDRFVLSGDRQKNKQANGSLRLHFYLTNVL